MLTMPSQIRSRLPNGSEAGRRARRARRSVSREGQVGLALAGGGPLGITYEIGALNALAESIKGIDFTRLGVYVGVSAGSVVAAGLANGIAPREICRLFVEGESPGNGLDAFDPSTLLRPALGEYISRAGELPRVLGDAARAFWDNPIDSGWGAAFARIAQLLPTGLFDSSNIDRYLSALFGLTGRTNDFRQLDSKLLIVATDLDSGTAVEFGSHDFDYVPISRAVQASAALPLLFPPVSIAGRSYVDGALTKTMHASGAYTAGARLVFGINPLVPYDADARVICGNSHHALKPRGLPAVLSQTFRTLIHSRMQASFAHYEKDFADLDFVLLEPDRSDVELFFTNIFSYSSRRRLCEHAYQRTRASLLERSDQLIPVLARHGVGLRVDVLRDAGRTLVAGPPPRVRPVPPVVRNLEQTLASLGGWVRPRLVASTL